MNQSAASDPATSYAWRAGLLTAAVTLLAVGAFVFVVRDVLGWDFEAATRSPLSRERFFGPRYGGWLGSFGVIGWTLAAAVAALAATVCRRRVVRSEARFLATTAALSTVLLLADLFMLHNTVLPELLGIPKPVALSGLVVLAGSWALAHGSRLLADGDLPILVWAGIWYAVALLIDGFGAHFGWGGVREEAAKLIGVAAWLVYVWRTSLRAVDDSSPRRP